MKFKVGEQVLISNVKQVKNGEWGYMLHNFDTHEAFTIESVVYPGGTMKPYATITQGDLGMVINTRLIKRFK